jgi:hypothetical protein
MPWPLVGLLLLAAVGAALQIQVTLPAGSAPGEIEVPPFVLSSYGGRFALDFILTAAPFVLIHRWLTTHRTAA